MHFLSTSLSLSPEELVNHVDHISVPNIDQQRIVIVANPPQRPVSRGQAVSVGIAQPILVRIKWAAQIHPDRKSAISLVPSTRRIIASHPVPVAKARPITIPVIAPVLTPPAVPTALCAPARPIIEAPPVIPSATIPARPVPAPVVSGTIAIPYGPIPPLRSRSIWARAIRPGTTGTAVPVIDRAGAGAAISPPIRAAEIARASVGARGLYRWGLRAPSAILLRPPIPASFPTGPATGPRPAIRPFATIPTLPSGARTAFAHGLGMNWSDACDQRRAYQARQQNFPHHLFRFSLTGVKSPQMLILYFAAVVAIVNLLVSNGEEFRHAYGLPQQTVPRVHLCCASNKWRWVVQKLIQIRATQKNCP